MQSRGYNNGFVSPGELLKKLVYLLGLFIAMYLSELLIENAVFGGAVYLAGEVWVVYTRMYNDRNIRLLPAGIRAKGLMLFILTLALTVALVLLFPFIRSEPTSVLLVLLIAGFILQQIITDTAAKRVMRLGGLRRVCMLVGLHLAFLGGYALFFHLNHLVLQYRVPKDIGAAYVAVICVSALLCGWQCVEKPPGLPEKKAGGSKAAEVNSDTLREVHAYRIYNKMVVNAGIALNLSMLSFICYMRFLPYEGFYNSILMLCVWIAFIAAVAALGFWVLNRRFLKKYDRPAIFLAGLVFWILAVLGAIFELWGTSTTASLLNGALMGLSFACMIAIILVQGYEMRMVIRLGVGVIDDGAYARNTALMTDWSLLAASLLLLVTLTAASFVVDDRMGAVAAMPGMQRVMSVTALLLPMIFMLASLVYSLLQPLDRNYAEKLRKYTRQSAEGTPNPVLEERLKKILVSNYPRRIAVLVLKPLLRPFFPCRVEGRENVDLTHGPVVFICNHLEVYGPLAAVLHSPFPFRPWVYHHMLEKDIIVEQMQSGTGKVLPFLPEAARERLLRAVTPLLIWILKATDPIAVYRGAVRGVIDTIKQSAQAMEYDDNILLFPETDYPEQGVGEFFSGFVQVGKTYYRQTGKRTTFYPLYINKRKRRMTYGAGITFDPDNTNAVEKDRIVDYLRGTMNGMAGVKETE